MTTETLTLTAFLEARIAEDEAVALAASPGGWQYGDVDSVAGGTLYDETRTIAGGHYEQLRDHDGSIVRHMLTHEADANGAHIARHDPARVLATCKAHRAIVENSPPLMTFNGPSEAWELRALASIYADHPDFREEWAL